MILKCRALLRATIFAPYQGLRCRYRYCSTMQADGQAGSAEPVKNAKAGSNASGKNELKILMLHGFTQSGQLFKMKTGALSKPLNKSLAMPPVSVTPSLIYPTGPFRLRPSDIPGYVSSNDDADGLANDAEEETDCWAWFRRDDATGTYRGLDDGMRRVAETIREAGGVEGVVGFSQGGAMAALVAAAMEPDRAVPADSVVESWVKPLREANGGKGLKFAVIYSGFIARDKELAWLYAGYIKTPTLHFIGGLDTVVEESRSTGLADQCVKAKLVTHPGGHHVPVSKEWAGLVAGFIRDILSKTDGETPGVAKV